MPIGANIQSYAIEQYSDNPQLWERWSAIFRSRQEYAGKTGPPTSPREGTTVRQLTLISSTIKSHPKHDPSGDMTIPVCLYVEKMPQINRWLRLINHGSFPIDQPIIPRARSKPTNPSPVHR